MPLRSGPTPPPELVDLSATHQALVDMRTAAAVLPPHYRTIYADLLRATAEELSPAPVVGADDAPTALERLSQFFGARKNAPATIVEMAVGTGLAYDTIRTFIYTRYRSKFRPAPVPAGTKTGKWRWTELLAQPAKPGTPAEGSTETK